MNTAEKVAALEDLLTRVQRNRGLPRGGWVAAPLVERLVDVGRGQEAPEIVVTGQLAGPASELVEMVDIRTDHRTTPGMPAVIPRSEALALEPPTRAQRTLEPPTLEPPRMAPVGLDETPSSPPSAPEIIFTEPVDADIDLDEELDDEEPITLAGEVPVPLEALPPPDLPAGPTQVSAGAPSSDVVTAKRPAIAPPTPLPPALPVAPFDGSGPQVPALPPPVAPVSIEPTTLQATPPPLLVEAVEVREREAPIKLTPRAVTPERLSADDVGEFIGEIQRLEPSDFGGVVEGTLALGFG